VAKNHNDLIKDSIARLEELQLITAKLAPCIEDLPDRYAPLIKVNPYDGLYRSLHYLADRIDSLKESVESMITDLKEEEK
jgi:hypothetical protein